MKNKLKIVFAGTPIFALPALEGIFNSKNELIAVYTQPDRKAGRGQKLQSSPIKLWALNNHIPIYQPLNFKTKQSVTELKNLKPDIIVVIAYGLILPKEVLEIPKYGCINVHASILPKYRGASPIQQSILQGDKKTGVTIMQMDSGMDTGDILKIQELEIEHRETSGSLHDKLAEIAVNPLLSILQNIACNQVEAQKQNNSDATYAPKINKEDAYINWSLDASHIDRIIRAFNPWPVAWTKVNDTIIRIIKAHTLDEKVKTNPGTVLEISKNGIKVATGNGVIVIEKLQLPSSKVISSQDYINANRKEIYTNLRFT